MSMINDQNQSERLMNIYGAADNKGKELIEMKCRNCARFIKFSDLRGRCKPPKDVKAPKPVFRSPDASARNCGWFEGRSCQAGA